MIQQISRNQSKEQLRLMLKKELERSLLLSEEDKKFWLEKLYDLPYGTLVNLLQALVPKNQLMDQLIERALGNDQTGHYLKDLKNDIQKIKNEAFEIEDKTVSDNTAQFLEEQLKNL